MKRSEALGGGVIFLFGAVTAVLSLQMPIGSFRAAGSGLFPLCLGILLMALSAAYVGRFCGPPGKRLRRMLMSRPRGNRRRRFWHSLR